MTFKLAALPGLRRTQITSMILGYCVLLSILAFVSGSDARGLMALGASGAVPVMYFGAWWTPFTAIYLHWTWSLVLSLLLIRQFGTGLEVVFGRARYFIIFVSSGAFGYFSSSVVGLVGVRGAAITAGSGPALGGLIAAAFVYGKYQHTEEGALIAARALMYAGLSLFWSLVMPGIDITANASGLCAGYIVARLLVGQAGMPEGPGLKGTAIALATVCVGGLIASLVTLGGSR